ncbi:5958_t:CDS:2, partial [Racocetra fulgida]
KYTYEYLVIEYSKQLEKTLEGFGIRTFDYSQFRNTKIVGCGGSAVVYSAVFQGKKYALKSLKNNLSFDKKILSETKHNSYEISDPSIKMSIVR